MSRQRLFLVLLLAACATAPPAPQRWKNLRVLPRHISHDDLVVTMRGWSRSLGVSCDHCHVVVPPARAGLRATMDFVSDAKPEKRITRAMLRMTTRLNADSIVPVARDGVRVSCYTCHRGKAVPDAKLPPEKES